MTDEVCPAFVCSPLHTNITVLGVNLKLMCEAWTEVPLQNLRWILKPFLSAYFYYFSSSLNTEVCSLKKRSKSHLEIVCSCYNCKGDISCAYAQLLVPHYNCKWKNSLFAYSHFDCSHLAYFRSKSDILPTYFKNIYSSF